MQKILILVGALSDATGAWPRTALGVLKAALRRAALLKLNPSRLGLSLGIGGRTNWKGPESKATRCYPCVEATVR